MAKYISKKDLPIGIRFVKICEFLFSGWSRKAIAERLGLPNESRIRLYEQGSMPETPVLIYFDREGISIEWFLLNKGEMLKSGAVAAQPASTATEQSDIPPPNAIRQAGFDMKEGHARRFIVPGKAAAFEGGGFLPGLMSDDRDVWDDIDIPDTTYFVKISGDSMSPVLLDGQYAMMGPEYLRNSVPPNRSIVVVQVTVNDEDQDGTDGPYEGVYCKRIIDGESCWLFRSLNPAFRDFTIHKNDCRLWPVIGVYFAGHGVPPEED